MFLSDFTYNNAATKKYDGNKTVNAPTFNLTGVSANAIATLMIKETSTGSGTQGQSYTINNVLGSPDGTNRVIPFLDASGNIGSTLNINAIDNSNYTDRFGQGLGAGTYGYRVRIIFSGTDTTHVQINNYNSGDIDTEIKVAFIGVGVDAPVAAFSGTPRKKLDSLTSQFTDESTNSPTSWSWKRRPSGIKANYVEFSTDENPSEGFDITDPTP